MPGQAPVCSTQIGSQVNAEAKLEQDSHLGRTTEPASDLVVDSNYIRLPFPFTNGSMQKGCRKKELIRTEIRLAARTIVLDPNNVKWLKDMRIRTEERDRPRLCFHLSQLV